MDFKSWILERITPVVMVVSSPEAEAIVQEANGLSIVDLLRPYGYFHHLSVPVRTVGEQSHRIREFRLRFYSSGTMFQPQPEVANEYLKGVLSTAAAQASSADVPDVMAALRTGELQDNTPWFDAYRSEFYRMLYFGEVETFDHPVACLLVLHASVANPAQAFEDLLRSATLPPAVRAAVSDPAGLRHYLLLYDDRQRAAGGGLAAAEEKLRGLRGSLGPSSVHLLRLNTGSGDPSAGVGYSQEGQFSGHMRGCVPGGGAGEPPQRPPVPDQGLGAYLSTADLEGVAKFLEDFTIRSLLPYMEQRVRALNHQVTSARKGLRNQLKTLLWRKSTAPSAPSTPTRAGAAAGPSYAPDSLEAQMRQLADLAFMLQDHDTSLSTLRLLAADYKADKAWKLYAAAQEMLALVTAMADGPPADVLAAFKEAFYRYNSIAPRTPGETVGLATRAMLLLAHYCRQQGMYSEANYALMKAHFQEENLRAALLLEQAALCLLRVRPPAIRKFAFHMVLAGLRYNACDQKQLGIRAYRYVLGVYAGRQWAFIEEHLHDVVGKQSREAGDVEAAVQHFMAMLPCGHSPEYWQAAYLRQFLDAMQQLAGTKGGEVPVLDLPLPEVDIGRVRVAFDGQVSYGNAAALVVSDEQWRQLEGPFLPGSDGNLASWLDGSASRASLAALALNTCVAGETVGIDVQLANPLAVTLQVSRLRAVFDFELAGGGGAAAGAGKADVEALEEDVELVGGARVVVRLRLRPGRPGMLTIRGLAWLLNGHAHGRREFVPRRPRHSRNQSRMTREMSRLSSQNLAFSVIPAMPRLEATLLDAPASLLQGELVRCRLRLRNEGASPLHNIRCVVSHPDVALEPDNATLASDSLACLAGTAGRQQQPGASPSGGATSSELEECGVILRGNLQMFAWGGGAALAPGEQLEWPLWLHPRAPGPLRFRTVYYYEPTTPVEGMRYRLLRLSYDIEVTPSLQIAASLGPSHDDLHRCVLRLGLDTAPGVDTVSLRQVSCTSPGWRLSSFPEAAGPGPASSAAAPPPATSTSSSSSSGTPQASIPATARLAPSTTTALSYRLHPPLSGDEDAGPAPAPPWLEVAQGMLRHYHQQGRMLLQHKGTLPARTSRATGESMQAGPSGGAGDGAGPGGQEWGADLALLWAVPRGSGGPPRVGVHHLYNLQMEERVAVRMVLRGPPLVRHDFRHGPAAAALTLSLRNCLARPAAVTVEAGPQAPPALTAASWTLSRSPGVLAGLPDARLQTALSMDAAGGSGPPLDLPHTGDYVWCGRTRAHLPRLDPGAEAHVPLQVTVFQAGSYELGELSLTYTFPDIENLHALRPAPAFLLNVEDSSEEL